MNAFTNAILSLLLGWLRTLVNAAWAALSGEGGGILARQLALHWKTVFIVLCVGGFAVDRVIYVLRWRPYYVWRSRRDRRRARRAGYPVAEPGDAPRDGDLYAPPPVYGEPEPTGEPEAYPDAYEQRTARYRPVSAGFAPAYRRAAPEPAAQPAEEPTRTLPPAYGYASVYEAEPAERYAPAPEPYRPAPPDASFAPTVAYNAAPFRAPIEPEPLNGEPRFDDDLSPWTLPNSNAPSFAPGAASPATNERYLRDVNAGFAPQISPDELFAPRAAAGVAVHPGLDTETLQQNIGLSPRWGEQDAAAERHASFAPFGASNRPEATAERPRVLGALAKKARTFVSGEDESNPPTIRDLQSSVDVTSAYRAPVYPKKPPESEE